MASVCAALERDDTIASHHWGHGHCLAKGARADQLMAEILGRAVLERRTQWVERLYADPLDAEVVRLEGEAVR